MARAATARPVEGDTRRAPVTEATSTIDRDATIDRDGTTVRPEPKTPVATDVRPVDRPVDPTPDRTEPERPTTLGPKPRASLLATLGLIVAVAGALFVLTGTLAGYGIGLGAIGAVLSVLGLSATRRRHVAGKTDALFGVLIGLARW
ncbi:hypothetical protein GCM10027614_61820 [Micromonospora vulcania]